jgi:hypothetical protein
LPLCRTAANEREPRSKRANWLSVRLRALERHALVEYPPRHAAPAVTPDRRRRRPPAGWWRTAHGSHPGAFHRRPCPLSTPPPTLAHRPGSTAPVPAASCRDGVRLTTSTTQRDATPGVGRRPGPLPHAAAVARARHMSQPESGSPSSTAWKRHRLGTPSRPEVQAHVRQAGGPSRWNREPRKRSLGPASR